MQPGDRENRALRRSVIAAAAVAAVSATAPAVSAQSDEQRAAARSLAFDGARACSEQRWQDCVDFFQRAESLVHAPPHLLYAARAEERLGHLVKARELYVKMTREHLQTAAPQAFHDAQSAAEDALQKIEPRIAYLTVRLRNDGGKPVQVTLDGETVPAALIGVPRPVDPGEHALEGKGPGLRAPAQTTTLTDGARTSVILTFEAAPEEAGAIPAKELVKRTEPSRSTPRDPTPSRGNKALVYSSYGAFGLGAAGIAVGTIFGLKSKSNRSEADRLYRDECSAGCDKNGAAAKQIASLDDSAQTDKTLSAVGFIVGGVGVGTGTVLFLLGSGERHREERKTGITLQPWVSVGTAGVDGRF